MVDSIYSCKKYPAFIFDLEGTLSDHNWRAHFAASKQWEQYAMLFPFDGVNESVFNMYQRLKGFYFDFDGQVVRPKMIILTAKSIAQIADVVVWLKATGIHCDELIMRPIGNSDRSAKMKIDIIDNIKATCDVKLIFEDRYDILQHMRAHNLPVVDIKHLKGYY